MSKYYLLLGFLGEKDGLNVGQNTTLGNGDTTEEFVQFLVVANGQLEVSGNDSALLVVPSSVTGQLEDLGAQVLQNGCLVDCGATADTLGEVALLQKSVDSTNRELESSSGRTSLGLDLLRQL